MKLARCAYFSLFFMSNLAKVKESEIIKIDINVSPNVLSKIINYIYTGIIKNNYNYNLF